MAHADKKAHVALSSIDMVDGVPLGAHPELLSTVLQYLGSGQYLWVGSVCKGLHKAYLQLHSSDERTLYSGAFSSIARLQFACAIGDIELNSDEKLIKRAAGAAGDRETLLWARTQGMTWDACVTQGAAV